MQGAGGIIQQLLPVYLLILVGAGMRRVGLTKREYDDAILHLVFNVMYPCFILDNILGSSSVKVPSSVAWGIGLGFLFPVVGMGLAWFVAGWLGYAKGNGRRTFAVTSGIQNFGYTAIPVIQQLWVGTGAMAMLFVHNLGVELAVWSVGVMLISGDKKIPWKRLVNGPVVAVVVGLLLVALDWDGMRINDAGEAQAGVLRTTLEWLGAGAYPMALFVTGGIMMDMIGKERFSVKASIGGSVLRLAVIPLIMLCGAKFFGAPIELKQVLIVQAAMPAAMTPILLAKLYGGRPAVAVEIVVASTVLSLFTLPLVLLFGRAFLGL
ncbi:AEC family transporter [Haloferula chungangensis]|uniref:AEC family transporter n=1 Tax=Haloferula chungangensis TaxID=1048331 RepID=A0ABW2L4C8_9BACT